MMEVRSSDHSIHSLKAAQRAREIPRGVDREGEGAEDGAGIEAEDGERAESARNAKARGGRAQEERRGRHGRSASEMERTGGWALSVARRQRGRVGDGRGRIMMRGAEGRGRGAGRSSPRRVTNAIAQRRDAVGKETRSIGGSEREELHDHVRTAEGKLSGDWAPAETAELRAEGGQHRCRLVGRRALGTR
ncbi:hypothetical protein DFH09DRAFT_1094593 [Mycena vulgaris]|nr:hypothetical protein DFH09DRAFT_1094593 [Mycena vulgaris]